MRRYINPSLILPILLSIDFGKRTIVLGQEGELLGKVLRLDVVHSQLEGSLETGLVAR